MTGKSVLLAVSAGLATFLLVGAAVTMVFEQWIEFSVFVGLPAGVLAGVLVGGGVAFGLAAKAPKRSQIAGTVAGFSIGFLLSLGILVLVWDGGVAVSLAVSISIGLLVAILAWLRGGPEHQAESRSPVTE